MIVIDGWHDPKFPDFEDKFRANFTPFVDDWDFMIIGSSIIRVTRKAKELHPQACDVRVVKVDGQWIAVTYHS